MLDADYQFALSLQQQFNYEEEIESGSTLVYKRKSSNHSVNSFKSLTDPSWELIDPTPDIHNLFVVFDQRFFWNKLQSVCVSWSKRMTSCAGVCSYHGRGGLCSITLSEPLLKLRPRKDLIETLLHEMIHAYLFVTNNDRDRDGHGPEFHKHMYRINNEAGTNITVYHDFHDEVRLYQQHWWRCNGPCRMWKPYFGIVRRATNRAPGPNDYWWGEHSRNCGGAFVKIKEPENYKKKNKQKENINTTASAKNDLRNYFKNTINNDKNTVNNTTIISKQNGTQSISSLNKNSNSSTRDANIVGFDNLPKMKLGNTLKNSSSTIVVTEKNKSHLVPKEEKNNSILNSQITPFSGRGRLLVGSKDQNNHKENKDYSMVRNHWINKYENMSKKNDSEDKKHTLSDNPETATKRQKVMPTLSVLPTSNVNSTNCIELVTCPVCNQTVAKNLVNEHLDNCLKENENEKEQEVLCFICDTVVSQRHFDSHVNDCLNRISEDGKITCQICRKQIETNEYSQHQKRCLDDVFSEDITYDDKADYKLCPICNKEILTVAFDKHAEECLNHIYNCSEVVNGAENETLEGVKKEIIEGSVNLQHNNEEIDSSEENLKVPCLVCGKKVLKDSLGIHLEDCMEKIFKNSDIQSNNASESGSSNVSQKFNCPFCLELILEHEMDEHLNSCFSVNEL